MYLALDHDLDVVPVINKIDLPSADPERVINEIEDGHKHMTKCGFARCVAAHDDIHFFIAEVGTAFQMFFLDAGADYFFWVCQLHMEVFKCVEVIQTNI